MKSSVVLLFCFLGLVLCDIPDIDEDEFFTLVMSVPHRERYLFLKEHILQGGKLYSTGYSEEDLDDNSKISIQIYKFLYNSDADLDEIVSDLQVDDTVCLPVIGCIDPGDSAVRPT
ncbi:uncharacterized protein LOC115887633 isoform X2 [Sitophilus oryzae]|uniref:Uncharacterized protein LOC115887633 isoform X2 n=1 Tax=Sitophilus oryzae TaxID=7048 RepID=A0A6J2YIJ4_SITOR|nr:uncharacterized protein LOC115887633 isoform X2 [Sitophilus oryzae]